MKLKYLLGALPFMHLSKEYTGRKMRFFFCRGPNFAQSVKNLPAMQKTWIRFLGRGDSLEKEMATHSSVLAWRIPMDRGA